LVVVVVVVVVKAAVARDDGRRRSVRLMVLVDKEARAATLMVSITQQQ